MIAPLIKDKKSDPAVLTLDDNGQWVIPLLSGHVGRANELATDLAKKIGARAIVTTASDVRNTLTVDILGRELGWCLDDDDHNITKGCAAVVNDEPVAFIQETGEPEFWPLSRTLPQNIRYFINIEDADPQAYGMHLIVSDWDVKTLYPGHYEKGLVYRPKSLVLGLGCDRGTPFETLKEGLTSLFRQFNLSVKSIKSVTTVRQKLDEQGLGELCQHFRWPLRGYEPEELDVVEGIQNPSAVVKKYVGTRSVAEAACLLGAGASFLTKAKHKFRDRVSGHSMTIAVARIPFSKRDEAYD